MLDEVGQGCHHLGGRNGRKQLLFGVSGSHLINRNIDLGWKTRNQELTELPYYTAAAAQSSFHLPLHLFSSPFPERTPIKSI
jgi:hypothetical protein